MSVLDELLLSEDSSAEASTRRVEVADMLVKDAFRSAASLCIDSMLIESSIVRKCQ